jgi:4-hydroxy-tetrahydrodipicolinate synthase
VPLVRGVLAAALTPMRADLAIDRSAFAAHCGRLLEDGCHGVAIFGTTGEANSLSVRERVEASEALVADGVSPGALLPGTGASALPDAVELTREAIALGAGGVLVLPPFYYKGVPDDGLFRFFAELIERVGDSRLRLYLYHYPRLAGAGFSLELLGRLLDAYPEVVAGTKDSAGDAARIERLCRELPALEVFAGTESLLLETLEWGGAGCISATCNVTAPLARTTFDHFEAGRREDALAAQRRLDAIRRALEAHPMIPTLKGIVSERTGDERWLVLRPPLAEPDRALARELVPQLHAALQ